MPFAGIGLHVLVALVCAIHVVRSGQPLYWLFILFAFPLLGSLVYVFAIWLPQTRMPRAAGTALRQASRALDPQREVREARAAFDATDTVQNRMRLAEALLATGAADEAAAHYEACLAGPFASDLEIRYGAARAFVDGGRDGGRLGAALDHLAFIEGINRDFRAAAVALLTRRAPPSSRRSSASGPSRRAPNTRSGRARTATRPWRRARTRSSSVSRRAGTARAASTTRR